MSRYKIILNPVAGKGGALKALPKIEELLHQYDLAYELVQTEYPEHATELARQAAEDGFDFVVAAGGDGTSNEVMNGLMKAREITGTAPVMGVIPVGRGNDFAFGANIPTLLEEACALLASLPRKWIDIGKISGGIHAEGLYFGNGVGVGFDAVVGFVAAKMKLTGMLSYLVAALKTIFIYYKAPEVELKLDDQVLHRSTLMVSVMNGRRMGGGFMMAPDADSDDGLFNLCIVNDLPIPATFGMIARFMKGTQAGHPAVTTAQARRIEVTAINGTLPVHADGVTVCEEGSKVTIELIPRGLEIITRLTD